MNFTLSTEGATEGCTARERHTSKRHSLERFMWCTGKTDLGKAKLEMVGNTVFHQK